MNSLAPNNRGMQYPQKQEQVKMPQKVKSNEDHSEALYDSEYSHPKDPKLVKPMFV